MNLAIIGYGGIGRGLAELLALPEDALYEKYGMPLRIVAVSTRSRGSLYDPQGLDLEVLQSIDGSLDNYPDSDGLHRSWSNREIIEGSNADALVELSFTDIDSGQPALDHIRWALGRGMHVATANKGPIALAYDELSILAMENDALLGFEGTVMSGTPAISLGANLLISVGLHSFRGILNGTTNYLLGQMERGISFDEALMEAQALGYAEANPTADVEGFDAMSKVLILANTLMGGRLQVSDVDREGISGITLDDVQSASENGERWKLIGKVERGEDGELVASVRPTRLPISDPLANVGGATNAITYRTYDLGDVTLIGAGAGTRETAAAIIMDLQAIYQHVLASWEE